MVHNALNAIKPNNFLYPFAAEGAFTHTSTRYEILRDIHIYVFLLGFVGFI